MPRILNGQPQNTRYEISYTGKPPKMHYQICICRAGKCAFHTMECIFLWAPTIPLHTCDSAGTAQATGKSAFHTMACIFWVGGCLCTKPENLHGMHIPGPPHHPPPHLRFCWHGPNPLAPLQGCQNCLGVLAGALDAPIRQEVIGQRGVAIGLSFRTRPASVAFCSGRPPSRQGFSMWQVCCAPVAPPCVQSMPSLPCPLAPLDSAGVYVAAMVQCWIAWQRCAVLCRKSKSWCINTDASRGRLLVGVSILKQVLFCFPPTKSSPAAGFVVVVRACVWHDAAGFETPTRLVSAVAVAVDSCAYVHERHGVIRC